MEKKAQQKCLTTLLLIVAHENRKEKHNLVDTKSKKSNAYDPRNTRRVMN
jgi:hypothetical protein